jgi:hypothetical protein
MLLVVVLALSASVVYAGSMAVSFPSQSGWTVTGSAGAPGFAQANWVNTSSNQSSWGVSTNLVDNTGAATGAVMDWYASQVWSFSFDAADNQDEYLMDAGIASISEPLGITVQNIPYATYDVVVYFSSQLTNSYVSKYTVNSNSVYAQIAAMNLFGNTNTYVQVPSSSTANLQGNTPVGNYIVFKNVTGSSLSIQGESIWAGENIYTYAAGTPWVSVSGFQIVEVPEPTTLALLGMGLISFLRRRHN